MPFLFPSVLTRLAAQIKRHPHVWALSTIAFGLIVTSSAMAYSGKLASNLQTFRADLTPAGYTELSFDNSKSLIKQIMADGTISFDFTIHNVEGKTMTYPYKIFAKIGGDIILLDSGTTTLTSGASKSVHEFLNLPSPTSSQQIIVSLPSQQTINFTVKGATQ